jgi:sarcosine/dimethylglycine N-methyltransferase
MSDPPYDPHRSDVVRYYDLHPINEQEILAKLAARGVDPHAPTPDQLAEFDQDHYGGVRAVDTLIELARIGRDHHVLDICSGLGGPARWLAHRVGCRVTGLDLTRSRVESARRLTRSTGLDGRVDFVQGDATAMPFPDARFDAAISQEAWLHIADKRRLLAECARVLRPWGVLAFTDIVARRALAPEQATGLRWAVQAAEAVTADTYRALLAGQGFVIEVQDDLSSDWSRLLVERLAMYRSLRDTTVAKFGVAHFDDWDRRYSFFVDLFVNGSLGGVRFVARETTAQGDADMTNRRSRLP